MRLKSQYPQRFGPVHANNSISQHFEDGRIYGFSARMGGQVTLMKILSGFYLADSGQFLVDGRAVRVASPEGAIRRDWNVAAGPAGRGAVHGAGEHCLRPAGRGALIGTARAPVR
jgi:ABC-type Na+ transport system ATPase subunit NatA